MPITGNLQGGATPVNPTHLACDSWFKKEENSGKQVNAAWVLALWPLHLAVCQMALLSPLPEVLSLILFGKLFQDTVEKSILFQSVLLLFLKGTQRSRASPFSFLAKHDTW